MLKKYIETRREFPRLKKTINAFVISNNDVKFPAVIRDISPDGVQITYRGIDGQLLFDKSASYDVLKKLLVKLIFNLPYKDHEEIEILAHPVHHHHIENDFYLVGLNFYPPEQEQKQKINDYLLFETEYSMEELVEYFGPNANESKKPKKIITKPNPIESNNHATENNDQKVEQELTILRTSLYNLTNKFNHIESILERIEKKLS